MKKVDKYQIQRKVAPYRNDGGYWADINSEARILKNGKVILHLSQMVVERNIITAWHEKVKK